MRSFGKQHPAAESGRGTRVVGGDCTKIVNFANQGEELIPCTSVNPKETTICSSTRKFLGYFAALGALNSIRIA